MDGRATQYGAEGFIANNLAGSLGGVGGTGGEGGTSEYISSGLIPGGGAGGWRSDGRCYNSLPSCGKGFSSGFLGGLPTATNYVSFFFSIFVFGFAWYGPISPGS